MIKMTRKLLTLLIVVCSVFSFAQKSSLKKDLKNIIQDHLVSIVREQEKEQKTSTNVKSKRSGSNGA